MIGKRMENSKLPVFIRLPNVPLPAWSEVCRIVNRTDFDSICKTTPRKISTRRSGQRQN
jgi:hypothetical protein